MSEDTVRVFCRVRPSSHLDEEEHKQKTKENQKRTSQKQNVQNEIKQQEKKQISDKPTINDTTKVTEVKTSPRKNNKNDRLPWNDTTTIDYHDADKPLKQVKKSTEKKVKDVTSRDLERRKDFQKLTDLSRKQQLQQDLYQRQQQRIQQAQNHQYNATSPRVPLSGFEERHPVAGQPKRSINQPEGQKIYDKGDIEYDVEYGDNERDSIYIYAPNGPVQKSTNISARSEYQFTFGGVFDQGSQQKDVYDVAARPIVDAALTGYNGTIFAYGQTSTGKTYTIFGPEESMYGDPGKYNSRVDSQIEDDVTSVDGLVARTLNHLFTSGTPNMRIEVSYLEIYKEIGYDLFAGIRGIRRRIHHFSELPRVTALTTARGNLYLRNLSVFEVDTRKEALELLMLGNANRKVAETHLNKASSRSHCVFTIYLTIEVQDLHKTLRSKINLVDLAGSERVGKSHMRSGQLLSEAKNINLSLHHLQQVIVSLSARDRHDANGRRRHVPYRNSMLTMVLSDSLGGNSLTAMVATVSPEIQHLDESISTCRFAQRVSRIRNKPKVNEIIESEVVIAQLRQELDQLKNNYGSMGNLQPDEEEYLISLLRAYIKDNNKEVLDVGMDQGKIQFCYKKMREIINAPTEKKNEKSRSCVIQ